jgi:transposase-like protein
MFDFLTHINLPPYLLFTVIVLGILTYYFHKDISKLINRKEVEEDIKDLKSHDIFNTLERVKQDVSHMKFYTNGVFDANKSRMCSDFAKFKCNVCIDNFVEFLDNDFSKISSDELKQLVLSEMWGMHKEYIKQIRAFWLEKGINNEDVDYVIELFEKFRYDVVVSFQNRINGIFSSSYHKNNFEKILACYEMYSMGIDLLPKDMLTTFEALNGRFANIKYK